MQSIIQRAIELRKSGQCQESRKLLFSLLSNKDWMAQAHLQIAWSFDVEGRELDAVFHYQSALTGGLLSLDRYDALFGLASTLRSLGRYSDALTYFEQALSEYPNAIEIQPFYAMCLYNLGRNKEAVQLLLELLVFSTSRDEIKAYSKAISLYAKDLDRVW